MSDIPKYREKGEDRGKRLCLAKPHIYWSRDQREWLSTIITETRHNIDDDDRAVAFTVDQDPRWTPVQKD